jgi:DNA repair exonuclease SbcCD ATPase subunit
MINQSLSSRYDIFKRQLEKGVLYRELLTKKMSDVEAEIKSLRYDADLYAKSAEIFKKWLEDSIASNVTSISDLATTGLAHIITDQSLKFNIVQESKYNRLSMRFSVEESGVAGDPLNSFGGGAAVVISLILRLAIMQKMKMSNLLILDESMVALANAYVPNAAEFMRRLSEDTGINILMVTHNPEFLAHSHTSYEGVKTDSLHLKPLKS